nr:probable transaldolase [Leptinotarsa decemlineata]
MTKNTLENLQAWSTIVADTADYEAIKKFKVTDVTTNPSIILQVATLPRYEHILKTAVKLGKETGRTLEERIENAFDMVLVLFAKEILKIIPGIVHIQVDSRLAFDTESCIQRALKIVNLFAKKGIPKDKVMIKIPATWEGIQAAGVLENKHRVNCNLTTMFTLVQAAAGAEAGVTCLSPFVGLIGQWFQEHEGGPFVQDQHPGVTALSNIYNYFKKFGYNTKVLGAYFLKVEEIKAVAGCDLVTIPLELLAELTTSNDAVPRRIGGDSAVPPFVEKMEISESKFRQMIDEDHMATALLSEVVRKFSTDCEELENIIKKMLVASVVE